jgi:adenylate cyclase
MTPPAAARRLSSIARERWPLVAATVLGVLLCFSGAWRAVELRMFDWLVVHTAPNRMTLPITVVSIDEESMAAIGQQWPWRRGLHARLLDRLSEAGAAVVAFDLVFAEASPDRTQDDDLARAIAAFGPVVLASNLEFRDAARVRQWIRVDPLPAFVTAGASPGLATLRIDGDGVQRAIPLSQSAFWRVVLDRFAERHPGVVARLDADERDRIRYLGGSGTFPQIPYYRLLDPDRHLSANWKEALRDNIVLVGRTLKTTTELASAVPDAFLTPLFSVTGELMPGVEIHANIIANMIAGETLSEASRVWTIALLIVAMLVVGATTSTWHPLRAGLWTLAVIAAIAGLEAWLFGMQRVWLPGGAAMAAVVIAFGAQGTASFLAEQARRREMRRAFALYVAPAVVDEIIAHPEKIGLAGERREISLLFTDLAGFTGISERLPAEEAASLLNRHLTEMTEIVLRHGGTVDKFIGDAVMAFWGAPIADSQQSAHALAAAIDMQRKTAATRAEILAAGGPELRMRIGLHRGECIVGNLGGAGRFAYTAVGDCVNLASRLEGINGAYGTEILLSGSFADALEGSVLLRPVDVVRAKGKQQPVALFTPCDDAALIEASAPALDAYRRGDWPAALALWERLADAYPADPVARVFVTRLRRWAEHGWPESWEGVYTLDAK